MTPLGVRSLKRWLAAYGASLRLAVFAAQFVLLDLALRGPVRYVREPTAILAALSSVALWGLAGSFVRTRAARFGLALCAASLFVCELSFFRYYHVFLGERAIACAETSWHDARAVVSKLLPSVGLGALALSLAQFRLLRGVPRFGRAPALWAFACLPLVVLVRAESQVTPDLAGLAGLRALARPRLEKPKGGVTVPLLESSRPRLPNVLFLLTESVREQDYASVELARAAPLTRALVPQRIDFTQVRSVASYTAIAVNALLSGRVPRGTRAEVAATPLLFDLVRATRLGPQTPIMLYWSAQDDSWLERSDTHALADSVAFSDDVLGRHVETLEEVLEYGIDGKLADYVGRHLPGVPQPFFLLAHLAGTHAPYFVDPGRAAFRPYSHVVTWSGLAELHNAYLDALVEQDRAVAEILRAFLRVVGDEPYLIVFTSDHGEAFGDHHAIHHGQDLYDEQIHVPTWLAYGNGALSADAVSNLRSHAGDFVTHLDLLPTLLDALGVLDSFGMEALRARLEGRSLLRPFTSAATPIPVTNCTALFPCPLPNFGLLAGRYELLAQPWDDDWHCVDLAASSSELPAYSPICSGLRQVSRAVYDKLPNERPQR